MSRMVSRSRSRRGFTLILMTFMITVLLGAGAFAIDFGKMFMFRAQVHAAADAAALAGVVQMKQIDPAHTVDTAQSYTARHPVGNSTPSLAAADVIPGSWATGGPFTAEPSGDFSAASNNALKVTTRFTGSYGFARIFGFNTRAITATSIAVRGSVGIAPCVRPWAVPYFLMLKALYPTATPDPVTYSLSPADISRLSAMTTADNVSLKVGDNTSGVTNGNFYGVELPPILYANGTTGTPWSGGNNYSNGIGESCAALATQMGSNPNVGVGDWLAPENGNMKGPTKQGFQDLCGLSGSNYVCSTPVRITVALWDQSGDAPGVSGCGGKCFHVKYLGVFYVTQYDTGTDAVMGYFQTMVSTGGFVATPGPIIKNALVQ